MGIDHRAQPARHLCVAFGLPRFGRPAARPAPITSSDRCRAPRRPGSPTTERLPLGPRNAPRRARRRVPGQPQQAGRHHGSLRQRVVPVRDDPDDSRGLRRT